MVNEWWVHFLWILAAGGLSFAVAALFAGWLQLRRPLFLVPYVALVGAFLYGYFRWSDIDVGYQIGRNWVWGLVAAVVVGAMLVKNVLSQPASPRSQGARLGFDLLWSGVVYGSLDALLLSVMPVLATWEAASGLGWTSSVIGQIGTGVIALGASSLVTAAYHVGYPEFRASKVLLVVLGNGIISLAYILTFSPLAALGSHAAMHVAAVLHGPEATLQLPPHYEGSAGVPQQLTYSSMAQDLTYHA